MTEKYNPDKSLVYVDGFNTRLIVDRFRVSPHLENALITSNPASEIVLSGIAIQERRGNSYKTIATSPCQSIKVPDILMVYGPVENYITTAPEPNLPIKFRLKGLEHGLVGKIYTESRALLEAKSAEDRLTLLSKSKFGERQFIVLHNPHQNPKQTGFSSLFLATGINPKDIDRILLNRTAECVYATE